MPCWTITTVNVSLNTADLDILQKGLENELGVKVVRRGDVLQFYHSSNRGQPVTIQNGQVNVVRGNESLASQINVAYSRQSIREVATRFRWQAQETKQNTFILNRRF